MHDFTPLQAKSIEGIPRTKTQRLLAMNVLYPQFRLSLLPSMLRYAFLGALVAGIYGIIHDQFTYFVSAESISRHE